MIAGRSIENLLLPFHRMGQQRWLEAHRHQSHMMSIGHRWPDTLATHPPASSKVACVQERARAAFEDRSTQYLYANATARAVEGDLGGFLRVARMRTSPLGAAAGRSRGMKTVRCGGAGRAAPREASMINWMKFGELSTLQRRGHQTGTLFLSFQCAY
jgi:hypothetical protein